MRDAFVKAITELAEANPTVMLITADLGFGIFDDFSQRFPSQFLNVGVAEQNMTGIATGMALEGYRVFTYSIGNFATLRCLEQIRNDACYHDANVTIVASGGGFTYGSLGMSHHATEDVAILRALPGVKVVAPADAWEAGEATKALALSPGVGYLRIEKSGLSTFRLPNEVFKLGKARRLKEGKDLTFVSMGGIISEVYAATEKLESTHGVKCRVISMHSVKPLDGEELSQAATETGGIITVEEHNRLGGLGGAVCEFLMNRNCFPGFFRSIGMSDIYSSVVGDQSYLRKRYGLDSESIYLQALECLGNKSSNGLEDLIRG